MLKLFKYLKKSWPVLIVIIAFLGLQAISDLTLPSYTADIIDVGISQGGIADAVPKTIREERLSALSLYMTQDEYEQTVLPAYRLDGGLYTLSGEKTDALKTLFTRAFAVDAFLSGGIPESVTGGMALGGMEGFAVPEGVDARAMLSAAPDAMRVQILEKIDAGLSNVSAQILFQLALPGVKAEYTAQGLDLGAIQNNYVLIAGLKMLGVALLGTLCAVIVGFLSSRLAASFSRDLRGRVFKNVVSFSNREMENFSTASLITRTTNDIQQVQMMLIMLTRIVIYAPMNGIGGIIKVMQTNSSMTWIIALAVALLLIIISVLLLSTMPKFKKLQMLIDKLNLVTREVLTGLPVIRAFSAERKEEQRFDDASIALKKTQLFVNRTMSGMMPMMMLIMNGVAVLIMWVGAHGISDGSMQVGDMMAFIQYTMQIIMSFLMISMVSVMMPRAMVALNRIDEVVETKPSIVSKDNPTPFKASEKGVVRFDHVSFTYPDAKEPVISDISFTARPGQTTAILGGTGSGKSTLINLIPRFFDVTGGKIEIDGVDIRDASLDDLRQRIGFIPQKGVLFTGTIGTNIAYGAPGINPEQMARAARIAQAEDFILEKPGQYDDTIAQGGTNVSGGQKQRLSIARAVAKDPEVYVFDDSFSALDYKTDVALRAALKKETKDATVIIVAQRISTVLSAEQIIVLDDGRIAGVGTHSELMASCDVYRQIAASQLSKEELENAK